jgi:hypothetical protein
MIEAFEGNTAETSTMLPTIEAFMAANQLVEVTIMTDAGMISEANKRAIEAARLSFILGVKIPDIPYVVQKWRREHPGEQMPDGLMLTQPRRSIKKFVRAARPLPHRPDPRRHPPADGRRPTPRRPTPRARADPPARQCTLI